MRDRVERITLAVKPKRWSLEARALFEQTLIDGSCGPATFTNLPAHQVDDPEYLFRMRAGIGDGEHAAARLPADENP